VSAVPRDDSSSSTESRAGQYHRTGDHHQRRRAGQVPPQPGSRRGTRQLSTARRGEDDGKLHPPIEIAIDKDQKQYLYYKDSRVFTQLQQVMDGIIGSFISETVMNQAACR
jgi:hypothetical protein